MTGAGSSGEPAAWRRRRVLSATIRVVVTILPVVASFGLALVGHTVVPAATSPAAGLLRAGAILAVSLLVLAVVDTTARKFLPLATLLQLSLIFPDQTPSRFKLALRSGSGRRLARAAGEAREQGLSDEPSLAAEQLLVLATAIGDHDRRTRGHSERVRLYAELIGEELGLDDEERAKLQWAALIHDIGKVTVPPEILNKKGRPDEREWAILQQHPSAGEGLVERAETWLGEWVHAVGGHHERWDGSGYPRGLSGGDIPRSAAIVAVADSFEVMTAVRSYKKAMTLADARREMTRCAGTHFSPHVVRAFLNVSIGDLRRSMGIFAALAHVPFLGRVSTAAAYAPDTVSTAVGVTTSAASAGAGAVAVTAAIAVATPSVAAASTPAPVLTSSVAVEAVADPAPQPDLPASAPAVADVAAAETVLVVAAVQTGAVADDLPDVAGVAEEAVPTAVEKRAGRRPSAATPGPTVAVAAPATPVTAAVPPSSTTPAQAPDGPSHAVAARPAHDAGSRPADPGPAAAASGRGRGPAADRTDDRGPGHGSSNGPAAGNGGGNGSGPGNGNGGAPRTGSAPGGNGSGQGSGGGNGGGKKTAPVVVVADTGTAGTGGGVAAVAPPTGGAPDARGASGNGGGSGGGGNGKGHAKQSAELEAAPAG